MVFLYPSQDILTNVLLLPILFYEYSSIHYVDFSGADLTGIETSNVAFRDSKFIGTKLNDSKMDLAVFFYVDFSNADLKGTVIDKATIVGDTVRTCKNNQICN